MTKPAAADMRELLEAFERLTQLPTSERVGELQRIEAEDAVLASRLRDLIARQPEAEQWFDDFEHVLGRGLAAELDAAWAPGRLVGPYRLERLLATGGMDAVFLARKADGELKRPVALKLVPPGLLTDESRDRVRRERDMLASLAHPNIAPLLDAGVDENGQPWFAMEYIEGQRFGAWCKANRDHFRGCVEQLRILAEAVAFAHRNLVVHGDLKPGNVLIDREQRLRLLDFGIARMLDDARGGRTSRHLTPGYAAPEILAGGRPRPASDVYALGRMLGEMLDGTPGHDGTPGQARNSRELRAIADKAIARAPEDRYGSAGAFADDLRRWLEGEPIAAWPGGVMYRLAKRVQRHPWATSGIGLAVALLVAFSVVSRIQADRFERERDSARQLAAFLEQVFVSADPDRAPGEVLTARELLDRGRAGLSTEQLDPVVRSRFLSILGRTYQRLGDYGAAGQLLDEALAGDPGGTASSLAIAIERAETDRLAGDFERAEAAYRELLDRIPEMERQPYARALSGLGRTVAQAGRPAEAIPLLEQGLELTRSLSGEDLETLADRLNDLGSALFRLGRFDEAISHLEEALPLRRQADRDAGFDRGSPRTATLINNLALMHYLQGRPERAEPRFREALALRRALLPVDHPDLAQTLSNLGLMLKDYGDVEEAVQLLSEALDVRRAGLYAGHYRIAQAMLNLGIAHRESGDLASADDLLPDALARLSVALGERHPQVAVAHNELGRLRLDQGRADDAVAAHRRALAIQRVELSEGHPHLAWTLLGLGRALVFSERFDEARPILVEAVEIRRATLPEQDPLRLEAERELRDFDARIQSVEEADPVVGGTVRADDSALEF